MITFVMRGAKRAASGNLYVALPELNSLRRELGLPDLPETPLSLSSLEKREGDAIG